MEPVTLPVFTDGMSLIIVPAVTAVLVSVGLVVLSAWFGSRDNNRAEQIATRVAVLLLAATGIASMVWVMITYTRGTEYRTAVTEQIAHETGIQIIDPSYGGLDTWRWNDDIQAVLASVGGVEQSCLIKVTERTEQTVTVRLSCSGDAGKPHK